MATHTRETGSPLLPKPVDQFRDYAHARPRVEEFYALNHTHQTLGFVLRYHSFYPWHKEGEDTHLTDETDRSMLKWVRAFHRYDLYSKGSPRPDVPALMPYYRELVEKFFPDPLRW